MSTRRCNLCGSAALSPLLDFGAHPIAKHFLTSAADPEYVHPLALVVCTECGLTQIENPVPPEKLYSRYVTLSSWKNQPHVPHLLELIARLPGVGPEALILEVGSNDGSFLDRLRQEGYRKLVGIEPAQDACEAARAKGLETISAYFGPEMAGEFVQRYGQADLIIARQVLEHISDLRPFFQALRATLREGGHVLIEVPDFGAILRSFDYSAIWEEHVNYFTLPILARALAAAGISVAHSESVLFSGEALIVIGQFAGEHASGADDGGALPAVGTYLPDHLAQVARFRDVWPAFTRATADYLSREKEAGRSVVVYGAGCRSCSFINFTGISRLLDVVLDDQAEKQNLYMPGSRLPILPGRLLEQHAPGVCLLGVNTENEEKVIGKHAAYEDTGGRFYSVLPPSERLLPVWGALA